MRRRRDVVRFGDLHPAGAVAACEEAKPVERRAMQLQDHRSAQLKRLALQGLMHHLNAQVVLAEAVSGFGLRFLQRISNDFRLESLAVPPLVCAHAPRAFSAVSRAMRSACSSIISRVIKLFSKCVLP